MILGTPGHLKLYFFRPMTEGEHSETVPGFKSQHFHAKRSRGHVPPVAHDICTCPAPRAESWGQVSSTHLYIVGAEAPRRSRFMCSKIIAVRTCRQFPYRTRRLSLQPRPGTLHTYRDTPASDLGPQVAIRFCHCPIALAHGEAIVKVTVITLARW